MFLIFIFALLVLSVMKRNKTPVITVVPAVFIIPASPDASISFSLFPTKNINPQDFS